MPTLKQIVYNTIFSIIALAMLPLTHTETSAAAIPNAFAEIDITNLAPGEFVLTAPAETKVRNMAIIVPMPAKGLPLRDWATDQGTPFFLSNVDDRDPAASCLSIPRNRPVFTSIWNGSLCEQDCEQKDHFQAYQSLFQLLVRSCKNKEAELIAGPPFKMSPNLGLLPRWRATSNVVKANMLRLETNQALTSNADRLAGFPIVPDTKRTLTPNAQNSLLKWLRSEQGLTDNIVRRCRPQQSYGFLLEQAFSGEFIGSSEIAVDLHCNTLALKRFTPDGRIEEHYSVFDRSREELVRIINQILANQLSEKP